MEFHLVLFRLKWPVAFRVTNAVLRVVSISIFSPFLVASPAHLKRRIPLRKRQLEFKHGDGAQSFDLLSLYLAVESQNPT